MVSKKEEGVVAAPDPITASDADEEVPEGLEPTKTTATEDIVYPSGLSLFFLMASVMMSLFLVSLDRLIISTAIPKITDDFHSVTDIGWYASAYLLTNCAFQLMFGKLYGFFSIKFVFLAAIFLFEVGSALCGAAPDSTSFIVGRAIAGVGSAGIMSGVIVVIVYAVPLHKRPMYQGLFGAIFGLSSVIGPLLGGAFTSRVTWRWCFYINLPFGGVAIVFIYFLLNIPERDSTKIPLLQKILQLDLYGTAAILPGSVCLLLALQWGGLEYAWNDGRVIATLTLGILLLIVFVIIQIVKPDTATVPPRIVKQRSIAAGVWSTFAVGSQMMVFVYFLPIWFQAIKGVSAVDSGVRLLPMVLPMVAASIITGTLTSRIGYYTPFMIAGSMIISIGAGLLTTLKVDTSDAMSAGFQVLYGFGLGMTFQAPSVAAQTVLPRHDVSIGTSLMFFSQLLGGAIMTSVAQNVFNNSLASKLSDVPGFDPSVLTQNGATTLIAQLPDSLKPIVLTAYNDSLAKVFQVGLILSCLVIPGALSMEWRSVHKNLDKKAAKEKAAEEGQAQAAAEGVQAEKTTGEETVRTSSASTEVARTEVESSEKKETTA
ncbi:putative MFS multidrug transporter [Thozetella sp. PMI_491]|nr:putative MFS multidrug transporter [Thozetella sp. PMI_491]